MEKKSCFIIMPFSKAKLGDIDLQEKDLTYIFNKLIRKAVSEYKLKNRKVFTDITRYESKIGSIITGIAGNLNKSDLVIADLTGLNPNVMYELGVRHSLKRGTIIITQDVSTLPSDLRDFMCVGYKFSSNVHEQELNYENFKTELHNTIAEVFSTQKYDSPVLSYLKGKERYWREDEIKVLKNNIVIGNYIFEHFYEIQDEIKDKELDQVNWAILNARMNNLHSAINDLNISVEASILYEDIQAAKSLFSDLLKSLYLSDYFSNLDSFLPLSEADIAGFNAKKLSLFELKFVNYFKMNEGHIKEITFKEVFSESGDFKQEFMETLEETLELKAKELGLSKKEIEKMLRN